MADIKTALMSLNPMDFVTGMRKGFELGEARAAEERAKALAEVERQKATEFVSDPNVQRRSAETEFGTAAARLGQFQAELDLEAGRTGRSVIMEGMLERQKNIRGQQQLFGIRQSGDIERERGVQREKTAFAREDEATIETRLADQRDQMAHDILKRRAQRGDEVAQRELLDAQRGADRALRTIFGDPNNANLDAWEVTTKALDVAASPNERAYLRDLQRKAAIDGLSRNGLSAPGLATWLPRAVPGTQVLPDPTDQTKVIIRSQRRGPNGETIVDQQRFTLDVTDPQYAAFENYLAAQVGQKVNFIRPDVRQQRDVPLSGASIAAAQQNRRAPTNVPGAPATGAPPPTPQPQRQAAPQPAATTMGPPTLDQALAATPPNDPGVGAMLQQGATRMAELQSRHQQLLGPTSTKPTPETWKEVGRIELELNNLRSAMDSVQRKLQTGQALQAQQQRAAMRQSVRAGYAPPVE